MLRYDYGRICERDMDVLFLESFVSDEHFVDLFLKETTFERAENTLVSVSLNQTDSELGESDITVIFESGGVKHALLIEDKIDAIAMENQHGRYCERAKKAVAANEYEDYVVAIACPEKYRNTNHEAKKYEIFVSYESIYNYYIGKKNPVDDMRAQKIAKAISSVQSSANPTNINLRAVEFNREYRKYLEEHYRDCGLNLRTKATSNGWWMHYVIDSEKAYILHKVQTGTVDLTLRHAASQSKMIEEMTIWLRQHGVNAEAAITGDSSSIRIVVPAFDMKKPFPTSAEKLKRIDECFQAIKELRDLAAFIDKAKQVL